MKRPIAAVVFLVFLVALGSAVDAYVLFNDPWPDGSIVMHLQLGSGGPLLDGRAGWNASAEDALATWNASVSRVKFRVIRDSTVPIADNNGYNNVFFSGSLYGQSFDATTLAVTTNWYRVSTGRRTEADVVFNSTFSWNSYPGIPRRGDAGQTIYDLHRVALHEFGHVLGLNHPNQYGQSIAAIMNSSVSAIDSLQADDLAGAAALYGGAVTATLTPPAAPSAFTAAATGSSIFLSWRSPASGGAPTSYIIEAGSAPGLANLAHISTGNTSPYFSADGVDAGSYYLRVKAVNAAGSSAASNESLLVVGSGACAGAPGVPAGLIGSATGSTVTLNWNAAGSNAASYVIEAGSGPGLANLANSDLGSTATTLVAPGVGRGLYYVRMRAKNRCGVGPASNEIVVIVQ